MAVALVHQVVLGPTSPHPCLFCLLVPLVEYLGLVSCGRFLYSNSIIIRYKLFYRSRYLCPTSRADPVFLSPGVSPQYAHKSRPIT
jgi:hypothetical protein